MRLVHWKTNKELQERTRWRKLARVEHRSRCWECGLVDKSDGVTPLHSRVSLVDLYECWSLSAAEQSLTHTHTHTQKDVPTRRHSLHSWVCLRHVCRRSRWVAYSRKWARGQKTDWQNKSNSILQYLKGIALFVFVTTIIKIVVVHLMNNE